MFEKGRRDEEGRKSQGSEPRAIALDQQQLKGFLRRQKCRVRKHAHKVEENRCKGWNNEHIAS